jgi:hypothetical protein
VQRVGRGGEAGGQAGVREGRGGVYTVCLLALALLLCITPWQCCRRDLSPRQSLALCLHGAATLRQQRCPTDQRALGPPGGSQ